LQKAWAYQTAGERPADDTGEYIGTCECRLSSLLCVPRL